MIRSGPAGSGAQKFIAVRWYASAMSRPANPNAWNVSTLRAWIPSACPTSSRPGRRSIRRVVTDGYCDICADRSMPAGPAPTMSTSTASGRATGRSRPVPAAGCTRGSAVT